MQTIKPSRTVKCIITDCDGVLWSGILGEGGIGVPNLALQGALLEYKNRGVMLAISSKNELRDVMGVLRYKEMLLKPEDFVAMRVNWNDKSQSIQEIAEELHIGLDSIAFVDDSPQERAFVRDSLPGVFVLELPENPKLHACALEGLEIGLDGLTDEDFYRTVYVRADQERTRYTQLQRLNQTVTVEPLNSSNWSRAVQLCERANQFHLDLKRWTMEEISGTSTLGGGTVTKGAVDGSSGRGFVYSVTDRFGDAGRVGLAILDENRQSLLALVISCRVLGRGVEDAIIADIAHNRCKFSVLSAIFKPGPRNHLVFETFKRLGAYHFPVPELGSNQEEIELVIHKQKLKTPDWITIT